MLLLLDTHILLSLADEEKACLPPFIDSALSDQRNASFASVVSLWEVALKHRSGKLPLPCPLERWPAVLTSMAVPIMDLAMVHILAEAEPLPDTRDPFDRLLLAICKAENMRLVTLDRAMLSHPLALQPSA